MEKRERGSKIFFPIILRLLGRILIGGKGRKNMQIKINIIGLGKNIKVEGTLYTPCSVRTPGLPLLQTGPEFKEI